MMFGKSPFKFDKNKRKHGKLRAEVFAACLPLLLSMTACSDQERLDYLQLDSVETEEAAESREIASAEDETSDPASESRMTSDSRENEDSSSVESTDSSSGGNTDSSSGSGEDPETSSHDEHTEFDPYYEESSEYYFQEPESYPAPENWRELYPHGSAEKLDGTIAVISIFANDLYCKWDYEDRKDRSTYSRVYNNLKIACDYLTKESAKYEKDVTFVWDWLDHPELYYEVEVYTDLTKALTNYSVTDQMVWECIEKNIDSENIRRTLEADSVIYMVYVDAPETNDGPCCTRNFYYGMPYPYEIVYLQMINRSEKTPPAVFAHEMLHTFGAPDLYWTDIYANYRLEYGISKEYAQKAASNELNDIMRITWNIKTGKYQYYSISPEITDITAYYVGLTDESETVKKWGFEKSQHDK
ncbi:MAG: hypothetical protein K6F51_07735 [Acetatifactor sp.]|nr:hypothetical protein [Acetatifactor sp.]